MEPKPLMYRQRRAREWRASNEYQHLIAEVSMAAIGAGAMATIYKLAESAYEKSFIGTILIVPGLAIYNGAHRILRQREDERIRSANQALITSLPESAPEITPEIEMPAADLTVVETNS